MNSNASPVTNLTMPMDGAVRVKDYRQTQVLRSHSTFDRLQRISDLQLFPHSLTHIDVLSRIAWQQPGMMQVFREHTEASVIGVPADPKHNALFGRDITLPCTIVCFPEMANMMRTHCRKMWGSSRIPMHPSLRMRHDDFRELLLSMRITRAQLEGAPIGRGSFVLFYTGWREFAPSDGDLTHSDWYPWHPYLLNPYLDEDGAQYLLDNERGLGATGIGCDIGTLDSPLRYCVGQAAARRETDSDWDRFLNACMADPTLVPSSKIPESYAFHPVHVLALARLRLLIEQLHVPPALMNDAKPAESGQCSVLTGSLVVLPLRCNLSTDAILVMAMFAPGGR